MKAGISNVISSIYKILPDPVRFYAQKIYYYIAKPSNAEVKKCYGELHADKVIYIIRPTADSVEGLMSLFLNVVRHLCYAAEKGYVPVVDFANYQTQYSSCSEGITNNVWNDYFTQPSTISLEDAYKSRNVILSGVLFGTYRTYRSIINKCNSYDDAQIMDLYRLVFGQIAFAPEIMQKVNYELEHLDLDKSLGLYVRGTDYTKLRPFGHPVQPSFEQLLQEIDHYRSVGFKHIFLVTEDGEQYHRFKEKLGGQIKIVSYDRFVYSYDSDSYLCKSNSIHELGDTPYERGANYLVKIILLSKCRWFIGGRTRGSWGACLFNNGNFEKKTVFDLGAYQ